jgi:DNA-binding NtrC family response regulator
MTAIQILHLEDDGPLREVLKVALRAADPNLDLQQFISSDDAVAYIGKNHAFIDLYILDVRVPGEWNGMQVAQKIRDYGSSSCVVVTSAYRNPNAPLLASINCEWYPKPWHIIEMSQKVLDIAKQQNKLRHHRA